MTETNVKEYTWKNWDEIKIYAYSSAKKSITNHFSKDELKTKYFDCFLPASIVWVANDLAELYYSYMSNEITNNDASAKAKELQDKYNNIMLIFMDSSEALKAIDEAFINANIEYGTVEFNCPYCGEKINASRESSSNDRHKIYTHASCPNGCFSIID